MKTIKYLCITLLMTTLLFSCSNDDDMPEPVNEEEVITTVRLELIPISGGQTIIFESRDLDGDGPDAPINSVSGSLNASSQYIGAVEFLNELESPAEDITEEVLEEGDEHQVFYNFSSGSGSSVNYSDADVNGDPIGLSTTITVGAASTNNTLVITLRHEPVKDASGVSSGDITNAGGETDVEAVFNFDIN